MVHTLDLAPVVLEKVQPTYWRMAIEWSDGQVGIIRKRKTRFQLMRRSHVSRLEMV